MRRLGVGLLGCGFVGFRHAVAVGEVARSTDLPVHLAAVADPIPARRATFAETFGVPGYEDHRELLEDPSVSAVYVCTPTSTHLELVRSAAEAGKAVFCEKPLGRNLEEAGEVVRVVEEAGVPAQAGLVLRSSVVYQGLAGFLPELGELMAVVFRDDQHWPLEAHYGSRWRADPEVVGSGTLLEHSIHDLDLIRWLFGDPEVVGAAVRHRAQPPPVEDLAVCLLEVAEGPVVTLTSVWHEVAGRRSERWLEVLGSQGRARVEGDFWGELEHQAGEGPPRTVPPEELLERAADRLGLAEAERRLWRIGPLEDYWFLLALVEGRPPQPSLGEALAAHRLVEGVYRAAGRHPFRSSASDV